MWGNGVELRGKLTGAEMSGTRRFVAHSSQFIVSRIGAEKGAMGLVPSELEGAVVSNDFPLFDLDHTKILPVFLQWLARTRQFWELCSRASEGTTRIRLQEDEFAKIEIPLPPLKEQQRIVARIEELLTQIREVQDLRQQSLEEGKALWLASLRSEFFSCRYEVISLEDACSAIIDNLHSNPRYADSGIPCVRSPDVGWGTINLETALRTDEAEYKRRTIRGEPKADDIALVREGGGTGKAGIVLAGQRFSLGQRVMMLRPDKQRVLPKFFLYQLLSPMIQEDQIGRLSKGSASPHLNIGAIRKFPFLFPPFREQHTIVNKLDSIKTKIDALEQLQAETAAELDALLPSILDRAFKGEL